MYKTFKLGDKTFGINANKELSEGIIREFDKLNRITQWVKEISGVIGGEEHSSVYYTIFGPAGVAIPDEEGFKTEVAALAAKMPGMLNAVTADPFVKEANEIFKRHIPVRDVRKTPEQITESNKKGEDFQAELKAKKETWINKWCGKEKVIIKDGEMAVYLSMCFDDSHIMSDYSSPHATIGEEMLLGIVSKGPQTEKLARSVLNKYPDLAKLEWTWHVENWSMGHGNYLMSEWAGHEKHGAYDGRKEVDTRWEIKFQSWKGEFLT